MRTNALIPAAIGLVAASCTTAPDRDHYLETFDNGPGGWYRDRYYAMPVWDGAACSYSPWWLDANHAPPGAGYLHMVMWMYTDKRRYNTGDPYEANLPYKGNRFAEENYSRDLTDAKLTIRVRGEVDMKGAQLLFLAQAQTAKTTANMLLTGQPFRVTRDWTEQSVTLRPDPSQWTCLGARHDMTEEYGCDDIGKVLADVNLDIIFALFPVKPRPASEEVKEPDRLRAVKDYKVDQDTLPKGVIMFDSVRIDYARAAR